MKRVAWLHALLLVTTLSLTSCGLLPSGDAPSTAGTPGGGGGGGSVTRVPTLPPEATLNTFTAGPRTSSRPTATSTSAIPEPLSPEDVSASLQAAAASYLLERENAESDRNTSPKGWVNAVRPLMTPAGWKSLNAEIGTNLSRAWGISHSRGWQVRVTSRCTTHPDLGAPTKDRAVLLCSMIDETRNARGNLVPTRDIPDYWPYVGERGAVLSLAKVSGNWLVVSDQTDSAG